MTLENSTEELYGVHEYRVCAGRPCPIHNRSDHLMRSWPQHWRDDTKVMERINPFGGACPDPDSPWPAEDHHWLHGCIVNPAYPSAGMCSPWEIDGVEAAWIDTRYAITQDGRVWSFIRSQGPKRGNQSKTEYDKPPRELSHKDNGRGYRTVCITSEEGTHRYLYVHRLVLHAWRGQCPPRMESRHINGARSDNRLSNLQWGTPEDNHLDKVLHGTVMQGNSHTNSKLTEVQVLKARNLWAAGRTLPEISADLDIHASRAAVHDALIGRTWKHVGGPTGKKTA